MNKPYFENQPQKVFISYQKKSYSYKSHFHSFIEVVYCFSGVQIIKAGEEIFILNKGVALVIFPNVIHEYIKNENLSDLTESISVMCNLNFLADTFPELTTSLPENPHIESNAVPETIPLSCRNILTASSTAEEIGWAYIILSGLLKNLKYKKSVRYNDFSLPALITSYISDNFTVPLSINIIAKQFGYSPSYIAHLFCNQLKVPFKTYLNAVRCDFAQSQLNTTKKSITEIAYLSGYNSLNTFCRCFKNHTGKTPSEFRKFQL